MKDLSNGLLALPFTKNLGAILGHVCAGCIIKEQAMAADEVTSIVGAIPEAHGDAVEAFFKAEAARRYSAIRQFCEARSLPADAGNAMYYMNALSDQLHCVDELRADRNPLVRAAYALQLYRSILMGTLVATLEQAEEEIPEGFNREEHEATISLVLEHAFDEGLPHVLAAKLALEGIEAIGGPSRAKDPVALEAKLDSNLAAVADLDADAKTQGFAFLDMIVDGVEDPAARKVLRAKLDTVKGNFGFASTIPEPKPERHETGMIAMEGEPTPARIAEAIYEAAPSLRERMSLVELTKQIEAQMGPGASGFHVIKIPRN